MVTPSSDTSRAKRAFLAHMRHELRTPINAIMGFSELLLEEAEEKSLQESVADLQRIDAAGKHLLELVNSLLDQSRIESQQDIRIEEFEAEVRHALRTTLSAVIGYADILIEDARGAQNDDIMPDLQRIRSAAERMLALIGDILSLWQLEAGKLKLDDSTAQNYRMVSEAMTTIRPLSEGHRIGSTAAGGSLLIVDDNETNRDLLSRHLQREGHKIRLAQNGREALELLGKEDFDLILLDILMPEMNGYQVLMQMKADEAMRHIPVIMLSALDDMDSVVRCIELGADDYLSKPFNPILLRARIDSCLEKKRRRDQELAYLEQSSIEREQSLRELFETQNAMPSQIPGTTRAANQLRSEIETAAVSDSSLLILGEPGTEKRLVAQMIHEKSPRSARPFLRLDCADVPSLIQGKADESDSLGHEMEQMSAIFGHQKGSFSFASSNRAGYLELAAGGTLFLENVERLVPAVQERLLAYLQTGKTCRLGSSQEISIGVRIVASSYAGLEQNVEHGTFSHDLHRFLSARTIIVPPLRDRKRDLMAWVDNLVQFHATRLGKQVSGVSKEAMNMIVAYDWPNNVEELDSVVQRGVRLADGSTLTPEQIFIGLAPIEPGNKLDLLKLPFLQKIVDSHLYPGIIQVLTVAAMAFILLSGLFGPQNVDSNLTIVLVWALWWPLLVISIPFAGRFFCAVCPMGATGRFLQHRWSLKLKVPMLVKKYGLWGASFGFILIIWVEQVTHMTVSPFATSLLLLTILTFAVAASFLFERAAWCRFMCPLGRMVGAYAILSVVELRTNPAVCKAECTTHGCYTGTDRAASCPMYEGAFALQSNETCKLCGDCIKNCANKAIRINLRLPASEVWETSQHNLTLAMFVPVLVAVVFVFYLRSTIVYERWFGEARLDWLVQLMLILLAAAVLLGMIALATILLRERLKKGLAWVPYIFLPLAFAGELGRHMDPLLSKAGAFIPTLGRQFNLGDWQSVYFSATSATPVFQVIFLGLGFLLSIYLGHRLANRYLPAKGLEARLPMFTLAGVIGLSYGALIFAS